MDKNRIRTAIQAVALLIQNANFKGFFTGNIYQGPGKNVCVPGLNCYSCPGAVGACPIGSLQNSLSARQFKFPYYVLGLLVFFGAIMGRVVCGFLCPFGFVQDILYKIPFFIKIRKFKADKYLRYVKYVVLLVFVIILPICVKMTPFFCKYICPSGTLAGILLALADNSFFYFFGRLFTWKVIVLSTIVIASIVVARPFCKYLCPLGAVYGPFNKISLVKMNLDKEKCTSCGKCAAACDMCINPVESQNSMECIRCSKCVHVCPNNALHMGLERNK